LGSQLRLLFVFLGCVFSLFSQEPAPKRLALLLGNAKYSHLPPLSDVAAELQQMGAALRGAGFDVTIDRDFTQEKLQTATVPDFLSKIQPGDVCFFYFSGYAMQSQQDNYLLPVEFDAGAGQLDMSGATSLTAIQQIFDQKKAGLKILALEASRNDPRLMTQGVGLANPDVGSSREILFAFSAAPNQVAPDNTGVFTKYLALAIEKKGLTLDAVFRDVYKESAAATSGRQQTFFQTFVSQDFFFHKAEKPPEPVPVTPPLVTVVTKPDNGPKPGTLATNHKDREDYVWIPSGTFKMGCVPNDPKCKSEEKPQHAVTITKSFWMGRNEVQTGSYQRYVDDDKKARKMPSRGPAWDEKWKLSSYPVVEVTATDAEAYCGWAGGRLPTEAEWEYAARAGKPDQINPLPDGDASREKANFFGTKGNDKWEQAAPVRSFDPNAWGLFDMAGNVWEWCKDAFSKTYYQESPAIDPPGPPGDLHVVRGGSWDSDPKEHLRISYREGHRFGNSVGFRCVLPDTPATAELLKPR
jgi:formylglycine-generating enzyme